MKLCPTELGPCTNVECVQVCRISGERRLDVCIDCGELIDVTRSLAICTDCMATPTLSVAYRRSE